LKKNSGDYMRKTKFFIMAFVLVGIMFLFSGCGWHCSTNFSFEFYDEYMADKYVDLLLKFDETDELYTDYNCNIRIRKSGEDDVIFTEIPKNSEIVNYNKDGYRSMLMHMKDADLDIFIRDSEVYPDYREEYNGTPSKIEQDMYLPDELFVKCMDGYGEEAFLRFCNKYRKCRVAVFDKDGNIVQISKKIPLVSAGDFYLQDISYSIEKNIIRPYYIESASISYLIAELSFLSLIGTICCIITLIVYKVKQNGLIVSYKGYIIASSIFNIPIALLTIVDIYCALGASLTITDFFINLLTTLTNMNIFLIIILISICILINFIQLEKTLRMKKSLDISEKM